MQIECTNNMIKRLSDINANMRRSVRVRSLETVIDRGRIANLSYPFQKMVYDAIMDYGIKNVKNLTREDFMACAALPTIIPRCYELEAYIHLIGEDTLSEGEYVYKKELLDAGTLGLTDVPNLSDDFIGKSLHFGIYENQTELFVLRKAGEVVFSTTYLEYKTRIRDITKFSGNVLIVGDPTLFSAYLASGNPNITKITVLNADPCIEKIQKQLERKMEFSVRRPEIVCEDYHTYLKKHSDEIDYCYIDDFTKEKDTFDVYRKMMEEQLNHPAVVFSCWLEKQVLMSIKTNVLQYLSAKVGTPDRVRLFQTIAPDMAKVLEQENLTIKIPAHLEYCLTDRFAKELVMKIARKVGT